MALHLPQKVTLESHEILAGCQCGLVRQVESMKQGSRDSRKNKQDRPVMECLMIHLIGACAEVAVAKLVNRFWRAGVGNYQDPDVGHNTEVRCTDKSHGNLLVRPKAEPARRYFLVRGTIPEFTIIGWIWARDAKQPKWLKDPNEDGPVYIVPAEELLTELEGAYVNGQTGVQTDQA